MTIMLQVNFKKTKGQAKYTFDLLSDVAKKKARAGVMCIEHAALKRDVASAVNRAKLNINTAINDRTRIGKLVRLSKIVNSLTDDVLMDKYILGNLCHFLSDGTYVTYAIQ